VGFAVSTAMSIRNILTIWGFVIAAIASAVFIFSDDWLLKYKDTVSAEPTTPQNEVASEASTPTGVDNKPVASPNSKPIVKKYSSVSVFDAVKDEIELKAIIKDMGIKAVMAKLVAESNGGSTRDCHQEAHAIGRDGYKIFGEKAFQECDASCHSGCYHGAMEGFLNEKGTGDLAANISHVCDLFDTRFGKFECLHGVGHGILAYVDYDLPEAIKECKNLKDWFGTVSCYGGMFMENVLTGQGLGASTKADHATSWVNRADAQYPCNKIDQDYDVQYQCYQMQTSWMLTIYNYDFDKVAKECLNAPANMISVCFKSFGRDASGNSLRNVPKIIETCGKVPTGNGYRNQCIVGAVNVIVDFWGPSLKGQATELCINLTDPATKDICYQTLASRIPDLVNTVDGRAAICNTFEVSYQNKCQNI